MRRELDRSGHGCPGAGGGRGRRRRLAQPRCADSRPARPAGLLILDNCEHLSNAVVQLAERLLSECAALRLLVTRRVRLVVPFEQVYQAVLRLRRWPVRAA
jgi:predicted ATPase